VKVSGELRIPAALISGVVSTELSECKTEWAARLAWWP